MELEDEIKLFRIYYNFSPEIKLISFKIISEDQQINYDIIAKNNDLFSRIEEDFYNRNDKYKYTENFFLVNGNKIKKHLTLNENKIKSGDTLIIYTTDE